MRSQRAFSTAAAAPPGFSTVPLSQSIFTAPSSTTITHTICEGSAIDAKRFRTSTLSNLCAARSRSRACVEGVRVDRHAELEPREPRDVGFGRQDVALDLDGGKVFRRLRRRGERGGEHERRQHLSACPGCRSSMSRRADDSRDSRACSAGRPARSPASSSTSISRPRGSHTSGNVCPIVIDAVAFETRTSHWPGKKFQSRSSNVYFRI